MKGCYCYYTKMQLFSFFLSSFPFLISFQSLVGHQDDIRKEETGSCCVSIPWSALWPSICQLLLPVCTPDLVVPLLFWQKSHPFLFDLLCWPTVYGFWIPAFLSLFFRVQILFLSLSRCPRLLWQPVVFGKLKAVFQPLEFPASRISFLFLYQFDCTNISWELFNAKHCTSLILIIFTITPLCYS